MKNIILLSFYFSLLTLLSCLNKHEKPLVGNYNVSKFELYDSTDKSQHILPSLTLERNRTFSLKFSNFEVEGKWEAGDNGDWTYIDFYFKEKKVEGIVGVNQIIIANPWQFNCAFFKKMTFEKK